MRKGYCEIVKDMTRMCKRYCEIVKDMTRMCKRYCEIVKDMTRKIEIELFQPHSKIERTVSIFISLLLRRDSYSLLLTRRIVKDMTRRARDEVKKEVYQKNFK